MGNNSNYVGIVNDGMFQIIIPKSQNSSVRLTSIREVQAASPESAEISLTPYEGKALVVQGNADGDWIFAANITEQAGTILSNIIQQAVEKNCI